jgi:hypothetical protein
MHRQLSNHNTHIVPPHIRSSFEDKKTTVNHCNKQTDIPTGTQEGTVRRRMISLDGNEKK